MDKYYAFGLGFALGMKHVQMAQDADKWLTTKKGKHFQVDTETGKITKGNIGQEDWGSETKQEERREKVKNAFQKIVSGEQEVTIPALRNDLEEFGGTNDVSLLKGDKKKGLIHIADRHGVECIKPVLEAVANGKVKRFSRGNKTVAIQKDGYEAILSLEEHGKRKTWLLTGYDVIEG